VTKPDVGSRRATSRPVLRYPHSVPCRIYCRSIAHHISGPKTRCRIPCLASAGWLPRVTMAVVSLTSPETLSTHRKRPRIPHTSYEQPHPNLAACARSRAFRLVYLHPSHTTARSTYSGRAAGVASPRDGPQFIHTGWYVRGSSVARI
jgi:hypothetical protein